MYYFLNLEIINLAVTVVKLQIIKSFFFHIRQKPKPNLTTIFVYQTLKSKFHLKLNAM